MTAFVLTALPLAGAAFLGTRFLVRENRRKKKQQALAKTYRQLLVQHRSLVDHSEMFGYRVMALDRRNTKLIVVDHSGTQPHAQTVPLRLVSTTRVVEEKNAAGRTEKILLELQHKKTGEVYRICFFDGRYDPVSQMTALARKAQHWKNRVDINKYPGTIGIAAEYVL